MQPMENQYKETAFTEYQNPVGHAEDNDVPHLSNACSENGVSESSYYNWKPKYDCMGSSNIKRMKDEEEEKNVIKADICLLESG